MKNIRFLRNLICLEQSNKNQILLISLTRLSGVELRKQHYCVSNLKAEINADSNEILTKYRNIINNLSAPVDGTTDTYHKTNFGSIRFDDENPPTEFLETNNKKQFEISDSKHNLNYIDEQYFEKLKKHSYIIHNETAQTDFAHNEKSESFVNQLEKKDLNFIDSQYLSKNVEDKTLMQDQNISIMDTKVSEMNLVDKQYFAQNLLPKTLNLKDYSKEIEVNTFLKNNYNLSFNADVNEKLVSVQFGKFPELYSFAQSIDEDFELPLDNSNSCTFKESSAGNRLKLEDDLLALSESVNKLNLTTQAPVNTNKIIAKPASKDVPGSTNSSAIKEGEEVDQMSNDSQKAYDYIMKKRKEELKKNNKEENEPVTKLRKILREVPIYKDLLKYDFVHMLRKNILYNNNDIIVLCKPYGVPIHGGAEDNYNKRCCFNIVDALPELAEILKTETIFPVHRLDVNTTGVMLFAKTNEMAQTLKTLLMKQKIKKSYLAITKGIPRPASGVINIPISEGKVENHVRMVLRPDIPGFRGKSRGSRQAITHYKVLSRANSSALVMLNPMSGIKHQLRVHLGFGLACPVLGDHKYSHLKKMIPQKLPGEMLDHLQLKQTRVRDLPIYLHAFSLTIPDILGSKDLFVKVGPPQFFKTTMRCLELNKTKNHVEEVPELIFDQVS